MWTNLETTDICAETLLIIVCLNTPMAVYLSIKFQVDGYFPLAFGSLASRIWHLFVLMRTLLSFVISFWSFKYFTFSLIFVIICLCLDSFLKIGSFSSLSKLLQFQDSYIFLHLWIILCCFYLNIPVHPFSSSGTPIRCISDSINPLCL